MLSVQKSLVLLTWASVISSQCLLSATSYTWTGTTSTDWTVGTNWTPTGVPSTTNDNATIPNVSNDPVLASAENIHTLSMQASSTLSINSTILSVNSLLGSGTINLSSSALEINNNTSCTFSGIITGTADTGLQKLGAGTLTLSGNNTYTGGTELQIGTIAVKNNNALGSGTLTMSDASTLLLNNLIALPNFITATGNVSLSVPMGTALLGNGAAGNFESFNKTGEGTLTIPGIVTFSGDSAVLAGTLNVNELLFNSNQDVTLTIDGTLSGTGNVTAHSINYNGGGILHPGNSPGTIGLNADQNFLFNSSTLQGSIFQIEIDNNATPQNSEAIITGSINIEQGALVEVLSVDNYPTVPHQYVIATYTGDLTGTFLLSSNDTPLPPAQSFGLSYPAGEIVLDINVFFPPGTGNITPAANGMNNFVAHPCGNSPSIIDALAYIPTLKALDEALLTTQPSELTALAIAQQDAQIYVRNALYNRLEESLHSCCVRGLNGKNKVNLWASGMMGHSTQLNQKNEPGFIVNTPGAFLGVDGMLGSRSALGMGLGYTYSHLNWKENRGKGEVQTVYLSTYGQWATPRAYIEGALIGGYSFYKAHRDISFGIPNIYYIKTSAHNEHRGFDGSIHFRTGLKYGCANFVISPFAGLDYIATHEDKFRESGAQSLNLRLASHLSQLLTSEAGIDLSYCFKEKSAPLPKITTKSAFNREKTNPVATKKESTYSLSPFVKLSVIRESRFKGAEEKARFTCGNYSIHVHGLAPSRTLAGVGGGLNGTFGSNTLALSYQGKLSSHFHDSAFSLEYLRKF